MSEYSNTIKYEEINRKKKGVKIKRMRFGLIVQRYEAILNKVKLLLKTEIIEYILTDLKTLANQSLAHY
jgi:hypothetical protein